MCNFDAALTCEACGKLYILSLFRCFNARYCERPVQSKPGSSQRWLQRWHWEGQEPEVDSGERSGDGGGQGGGSSCLCGSVRSLRVQRLQRYVGQGRHQHRARPTRACVTAACSLSTDRLKVVCCWYYSSIIFWDAGNTKWDVVRVWVDSQFYLGLSWVLSALWIISYQILFLFFFFWLVLRFFCVVFRQIR